MVKGFYPPLHDREVSSWDWYTNYLASCVERDVRSILAVKDLGHFQTFLKMCAACIGQILNQSAFVYAGDRVLRWKGIEIIPWSASGSL